MKKYLILIAVILIAWCTQAESHKLHKPTVKELQCMTENIYFEARGEPVKGQAMVAQTVINRMHDKRWANTICGVVHQAYQYSWTVDKDNPIHDKKTFRLIEDLAYTMLENMNEPQETNATHYLRCDWKPKVKWWHKMDYVGRIGEHCFYHEGKRQ